MDTHWNSQIDDASWWSGFDILLIGYNLVPPINEADNRCIQSSSMTLYSCFHYCHCVFPHTMCGDDRYVMRVRATVNWNIKIKQPLEYSTINDSQRRSWSQFHHFQELFDLYIDKLNTNMLPNTLSRNFGMDTFDWYTFPCSDNLLPITACQFLFLVFLSAFPFLHD